MSQRDLPPNYFNMDSTSVSQEGGKEDLPEGFFLSATEIAAIENEKTNQADVPQLPDPNAPQQPILPSEMSPQEQFESTYRSPDEVVLDEFNRFADSYAPAGMARDLVADAVSVIGSIKGVQQGVKIADVVAKHPVAKLAVITTTSAIAAGLGQFAGEVAESAVKDEDFNYQDAYDQSVESAQWDAAGNLLLGSFGIISAKVIKKSGLDMSDAKKAAQALFEKYGTTLTRYQASGTWGAKLMENISLIGLDLTKSVKKVEIAQREALSKEMDLLLDGPSIEGMGQKIIELHAGANKGLSDEYGAALKAVLKDVPSESIDLKGYNAWAKNKLTQEAGTQKVGAVADTNEFKAKVNSLLGNNREVVSFEDVSIQLKKIGDIAQQARKSGDSVGAKYAGDAFEQLEGVMLSAANKLGSTYGSDLKVLRSWYKEAKKTLDSDIISAAMNKKPSEVGEFLHGSPEAIEAFTDFMKSAKTRKNITQEKSDMLLDEVRRGYLNRLIPLSSTSSELKTLNKTLRYKKQRELTEKVLGPQMFGRLTSILDTAEVVAKQLGDSNARFSLVAQSKTSQAYAQVGGFLPTLVAGAATAGSLLTLPVAAAIIISPAILGKLASKPAKIKEWKALTKILTNANISANSTTAKVALSRYMNFMDSIKDTKQEAQVNRKLAEEQRKAAR